MKEAASMMAQAASLVMTAICGSWAILLVFVGAGPAIIVVTATTFVISLLVLIKNWR